MFTCHGNLMHICCSRLVLMLCIFYLIKVAPKECVDDGKKGQNAVQEWGEWVMRSRTLVEINSVSNHIQFGLMWRVSSSLNLACEGKHWEKQYNIVLVVWHFGPTTRTPHTIYCLCPTDVAKIPKRGISSWLGWRLKLRWLVQVRENESFIAICHDIVQLFPLKVYRLRQKKLLKKKTKKLRRTPTIKRAPRKRMPK